MWEKNGQRPETNVTLWFIQGAVGLKMQSGLCCIPGFSNPSTATRKGKIPQPLLESMMQRSTSPGLSNAVLISSANMTNTINPPYKKHVLPPLPRPPSQGSQQCQNHQQQSVRTSSGPPFISPSGSSSALCGSPGGPAAGIPLSSSVDSMLADSVNGKNALPPGAGGGNVFTPVSNLPKGLPPRSPGIAESSKCRSLERDQRSKSSNDSGVMGKFTSLGYDTSRCKSLDRRELKTHSKDEKEEVKDKKQQKSTVGSKAAFFGGLLSRKSPSPSRKAKDKTEEKEKTHTNHNQKSVRFPFSRSTQHQNQTSTTGASSNASGENSSVADSEIDTEFLDLQGRSSQRSRISKWTASTSNLESLQEHPASGPDSPWVQRRSGGEPSSSRKQSIDSVRSANGKSISDEANSSDEKKWGKIVKSPFGLRYTFGSPKS